VVEEARAAAEVLPEEEHAALAVERDPRERPAGRRPFGEHGGDVDVIDERPRLAQRASAPRAARPASRRAGGSPAIHTIS